jgi:beta-phosphoglucomutase-like phosphatase (HAD superfamily)
MTAVITLSLCDYDAVLFDLDGVLTRTASVHAAAWKKLFDSFLEQRATQAGEPFVSPATIRAALTASRAMTAYSLSSHRAGSSCHGGHPMTAQTCRVSARWAT